MSQTTLQGFFETDYRKKVSSPKKAFISKHNKQPTQKKVKSSAVQQFFVSKRKLEPEKCTICGMVYSKGLDEDDELHTNFHRQFLREMIIPVSIILFYTLLSLISF